MTRYCPKCRGEYQDWVQKCADCGAELVDTRPEPDLEIEPVSRYVSDDNSVYTTEPLVVIAEFTDMVEAKLAREILESEGVSCFVPDKESLDFSWSELSPGLGATCIVRESDADKALEILTKRGILNQIDRDDSETAP